MRYGYNGSILTCSSSGSMSRSTGAKAGPPRGPGNNFPNQGNQNNQILKAGYPPRIEDIMKYAYSGSPLEKTGTIIIPSYRIGNIPKEYQISPPRKISTSSHKYVVKREVEPAMEYSTYAEF
jgi:hypothetical protein